jgi:hypothetical protein
MTYRSEKRRVEKRPRFGSGVWTHHVKKGDAIVFRGTEEQCRNFVEAANQFDLECKAKDKGVS